MDNLVYGFIVLSWLVIDADDRPQMIPFSSMMACEQALVILKKPYGWMTSGSYRMRFLNCVAMRAEIRR